MTSSHFRSTGFYVFASIAISLFGAPCNSTVNGDELPSAESILDGHITATGGKAAYEKLKTRKTTGTLEIDMSGHQVKAKVEIHHQAPNQSHMVIQGGGLYIVRATNGIDAWEWRAGHSHGDENSEPNDDTHLLDGPDKQRALEQAQFHDKLNWRKTFKSVKTVGVVKLNEKPAYEVEVTPNHGESFKQYYDQETGRLVKYTRPFETSMGKLDMEVHLNQYKEFDGVMMPTFVKHVLTSPAIGSGTQIWNYTNFEHNIKVPSDLFKLPEELAKEHDGN